MVDIVINARLGDGCARNVKTNKLDISFSSVNESLIKYKASIIRGNCRKGNQNLNAYGKKPIYSTFKRIPIDNRSKLDLIRSIDMDDFILWYLDDGSYHQKKHFMNLNCHALSLDLVLDLQFHLWRVLGIDTKLTPDKKRDGRLFWYLRIPRNQAESIKPDIDFFMLSQNISGLEYKIGKTSETIS
jgi:hypothetical protein